MGALAILSAKRRKTMMTQVKKVYPKWDRIYCEGRLKALYVTIEKLPQKRDWLFVEFRGQLGRWWEEQCVKYADDAEGMKACEIAYANMYDIWDEFEKKYNPQPELDLFTCLDGV